MKLKIMPPTYFILFLVFSTLLHFIFPIKKIIWPPYTYFGCLLIVIGIILNIWADNIVKKVKTSTKPYKIPSKLVIKGPFKISRHPMYLGMTSILFGVAFLYGTLITFIFPILFLILIEILFVPTEEKNMEKNFGKKYLEYKKKVRRWI